MNDAKAPRPASALTPTVEQAAALIGHVTNRGIQSEQISVLCNKIEGKRGHEPLTCDALDQYAAVAKLVVPVSGSTLVDSLNVDRITWPVRGLALSILILLIVNAIMKVWFENSMPPAIGLSRVVYQLQVYGLDVISPFLWGALGSCVYLLKRYADLAEARIFDEDSSQGWATRVLLGAILGGVVQYIYDSSAFGSSGMQLDANALGFLSGLGVKVVYGAIEKTIAALGEAMNLETIRTAPARENAVRKFLAEAMASEGDIAKRKFIAELLDTVSAKAP